jgi:hypothetical protein
VAEPKKAPKAPAKGAKSSKKGGGLSGSFHGIPKPVLAVGGGLGAFFLYRFWQARKAAAATTPAPQVNPAATGTDTGTGAGFSGTGTGGGGGGFGPAGGQPGGISDLLKQILAAVNPQGTPAPTPPTPDQPSPEFGPGPNSAPAPAPALLPTQQNLQSVATPVATPTSGTGAGGNPAGIPGTFSLKNGTVNFQPTAAVVRGNQVAYGIPNQGTASTVERAGGTVQSGATLNSKGWTGLTPGALYLLR